MAEVELLSGKLGGYVCISAPLHSYDIIDCSFQAALLSTGFASAWDNSQYESYCQFSNCLHEVNNIIDTNFPIPANDIGPLLGLWSQWW